MKMDSSEVARRLLKEQYAAVRQALTLLDERVLARYWDQDTPVRAGFERFLASLDEAAGWFVGGEIARRGQASGAKAEAQPAGALEPPAEPPAEPAGAVGEPGVPATPTAEPGTAAPPAAEPGTVEVTFTLPAEVESDQVALCGEFNGWATDEIWLARGGDGTWQVTVALEPGRSYRYRYLLDSERWENARDAERYEPNAFGSVDSVVVVE